MIILPPSKSIGARYLVATYFAGTLPADPVFEENDDLMVLQQALLEVYSDEEPIDYGDSPIDVGASGTALRFVTALCASTPGADYIINGTNRLMQRPMEPLLNLLREAGAKIQALGTDQTGPYRVSGAKIEGGKFAIRGDLSSQFISALMLVAPNWEKGLDLSFTTPLVSMPYLRMTARLMQKFKVDVSLSDTGVVVKPQKYKEPKDFQVEADWSSASFFYEASALGASPIVIAGLLPPDESLQGDSVTAILFKKIGVNSQFSSKDVSLSYTAPELSGKIEVDFKDSPDLLLPFAVACLCNNIHFHFDNLAHLRLKESDRLESLRKESAKLGFQITVNDNSIDWKGELGEKTEKPVIETYDDHRVAMSFAMTALKYGEIQIRNPKVVEKSFIDFWNMIETIGLKCTLNDDIMTVSYQPSKNI